MNLWLRLLLTLVTAGWRSALSPLETSAKRFRVWPHDLDLSGHMNNGRYLTIMDLGRLDLVARCGLWRIVWRERLTPVVGTATIRFRRELKCFQSFLVETRIIGWLESTVVFEQRFIFATGARKGEVGAEALVRAGIYDRSKRRFVAVDEILRRLGSVSIESPELSLSVQRFLELEETMRSSLRESKTIAAAIGKNSVDE